MTASHVRRLTLRAADDAAVRAGAILVEDALRIATLPHERDPRLFLLRRFDIGAFRLAAGAHAIAREIERRVAELVWTAVPAASEQAANAPAVWFPDHTVAIVELARRLAAGPPPIEWFWRRVAPGAAQAATPGQALRACLAAAAQTPPGPVAVARVVDAIERVRAGALLGDVPAEDAARLLAATFGTPISLAPARGVTGGLAPRWAERLAVWAPRWRGDLRATWLAAIGAIATRGSIGAVDVEIGEAQQRVAEVLRAAPAAPVRGARASHADPIARGPGEPPAAHDEGPLDRVQPAAPAPPAPAWQAPRMAAAVEAPAAPPAPTASAPSGARALPVQAAAGAAAAQPDRSARSEPGEPDAAVESWSMPAGGEPTTVAGVLFLLRPLAMLGLAEWLDHHRWAADAGFAAHLLASIAAAHAPPDDPMRRLAEGAAPDGSFAAPPGWRALLGRRPLRLRPAAGGRVLESSGRLPVAAWSGRRPPGVEPFLDRPVRRGSAAQPAPWALVAWRRAVARWSRRFAGLGCAEIVRRPAMLIVTPTHLDLRMALRDADVRVRLAGLDIDPGWVPWLGRVVSFRYE